MSRETALRELVAGMQQNAEHGEGLPRLRLSSLSRETAAWVADVLRTAFFTMMMCRYFIYVGPSDQIFYITQKSCAQNDHVFG